MTELDILMLEHKNDNKIKEALFKVYDYEKAEALFECIIQYGIVNIKQALFQVYNKEEAEKLWCYVCNYDKDYPKN